MIIMRSWFIFGLTKLFFTFICHCPLYLALQTRRYAPYRSLQLMVSPSVPFFILTLDFVLALPLSKRKYNVIMSMTYKFFKRITFIKSTDIWSADQQANVFLNRLDLMDWGLSRELITNCNPKFLGIFWTALFAKLAVKLLYNTAYYPQMDGSSKYT